MMQVKVSLTNCPPEVAGTDEVAAEDHSLMNLLLET
jgi:hypothetical protein